MGVSVCVMCVCVMCVRVMCACVSQCAAVENRGPTYYNFYTVARRWICVQVCEFGFGFECGCSCVGGIPYCGMEVDVCGVDVCGCISVWCSVLQWLQGFDTFYKHLL